MRAHSIATVVSPSWATPNVRDIRPLASTNLERAPAAGVFLPTKNDDDSAWLSELIHPDGTVSGLLVELTEGQFAAGARPDFLAVRTGAQVTGKYAGGFNVVGSVDGDGTNITWFSTGMPPTAMKGVAVSWAPNATATVRSAAIATARDYLIGHLADAQNAAGRWNQPTFDVRA